MSTEVQPVEDRRLRTDPQPFDSRSSATEAASTNASHAMKPASDTSMTLLPSAIAGAAAVPTASRRRPIAPIGRHAAPRRPQSYLRFEITRNQNTASPGKHRAPVDRPIHLTIRVLVDEVRRDLQRGDHGLSQCVFELGDIAGPSRTERKEKRTAQQKVRPAQFHERQERTHPGIVALRTRRTLKPTRPPPVRARLVPCDGSTSLSTRRRAPDVAKRRSVRISGLCAR